MSDCVLNSAPIFLRPDELTSNSLPPSRLYLVLDSDIIHQLLPTPDSDPRFDFLVLTI